MAENTSAPCTPAPTLPSRQSTTVSSTGENAVPTEDPRNTIELLLDRLGAWKHAVDTIEDYMCTTEKIHRAQAKEYEKVLKTIQNPLKAGHHFEQNVGGIASLFENIRQNTQALINTHLETEKKVKASILPVIERLRKEIRYKSKELSTGAGKNAKEIEKARNITQRHIELLGQNAAGFDASGSKINSSEDPYVLRRGVLYRLSKQVMEEKNQRQILISVQANFKQFEQEVVEVIQTSLASLAHFMSSQAQSQQDHYSDILKTAQAIPTDFEWNGFISRYSEMLVDPDAPDRNISTISFPNQDHRATIPIIEGTLERKSRNKLSFAGFTTGHYVVTMSKYLHEFKDDDYIRTDPVPELSIYLPDALVSYPHGEKFNVKGKDVSKGLSSKLSGHSDLQFKASSVEDAQKWVKALQTATGQMSLTTSDMPEKIDKEEKIRSSSPTVSGDVSSTIVVEKEMPPHEKAQEFLASTGAEKLKPLGSNPVDSTAAESKE